MDTLYLTFVLSFMNRGLPNAQLAHYKLTYMSAHACIIVNKLKLYKVMPVMFY